jgi:hypothetical protein
MTKIVYNACYGGFGLSEKAFARYKELGGAAYDYDWEIARTDPILVQVIEELGEEANNWASNLKITAVHAGTKYRIEGYDGMETVMTVEDYEWETA